ncbi:MAG: translocation/assembly module TamB domain-containing protein [Spirochaetales bacterium]|nr:translocation/assembly module TamB domain-containing protein [Spirochaetales bacterium]
MEELKTEIIGMLKTRIDREIRYQSVSPSVFGYLGIRELEIYSREDPDEVLLRISRVKIYYNLIKLLSSGSAALAVSEIQIANSYFDVDYDRDRELLELIDALRTSSAEAGGGLLVRGGRIGPREAAAPRIDLSGTNITLRYTYREWRVGVENLFFTVASRQDLYDITVRGNFEARHARSGSAMPAWLAARMKISGSMDRFFAWSDLALQIHSLSTDTVAVKRQTLQVIYDSHSLEVRKIQDRAPLDLQVSYDTGSRDLSVTFVAEGFRPADLIRLTGSFERFNPYLMSSVSSTGSFVLNLDELRPQYKADLRVEPPDEVLPFDMTIVSRLSGNEEILYLNPLTVHSSRGRAEFNGNILIANLLPSGLLRFDDVDARAGQNLDATLRISRKAESLAIESSSLVIGQTSFDDLALSVEPEGRSLRFALAAALREAPARGSVTATGELDWRTRLTMKAQADVEDLPLDTLYRLLGARPVLSPRAEQQLHRFSVSLAAGGSTDFSDFTLSGEQIEIIERARPENFLRLRATMDRYGAQVDDIQLRWQDYSMRGDVEMEWIEETMELSSLFWVQEIPYQLEVDFLPGGSVRFGGSYGLEGYYRSDRTVIPVPQAGNVRQTWGRPFRLRSENLPIALKEGTMFASFDVLGLMGSGASIYTSPSTVRIRNIPFSTIRKNSLDLAFTIIDEEISLDSIAYQDEYSSLSGSGRGNLRRLLPLQGGGSIRLQGGEELYSSEARVDGGRVEGRLEFARSPIKRLGIETVNGDISGSLTVDGMLPQPDVSLLVALNNGRLNLDPLDLDLAATYSADSLRLGSLNASFLNHRITGGRGSIEVETGEFAFESEYRAEYFQQIVDLRIDLRGSIGELPWPPSLDGILENESEGVLSFSDITVDGQQRPGWAVALSGDQGVLTFSGGPGDSIEGAAGRDGSFTLNLGQPLPVQGRWRGTIARNQLDSHFTVTALDMRMINTMTPNTDVFTFTAGSAAGDLRIFGPVNDPDWVGYLDVSRAELSFKPSPDPVKPLNARLIFDGKSFTLPRTTSYSGKTKIEGEGFFYIDHWVPEGVELIFYAQEYPGVHIAYAFDPVFVDGYATGAVRVRSDRTTAILDGKIQANSCRIAMLRDEEQRTVSRQPAIPLLVDMDISTGRSVEFFWPAMNFPIIRTFARQGEQISLYVNDETSEFFIEGEVEIRGGEIFYFDRSFYLRQGSISFEERVDEFDPWIYALAEIRERDLNDEEIKIYLEANNKLSMFSPRFYSDPSRPDVEILNLIGGTILNRFEQTDFGTAAVMLTSDIIGQFGILTPLERAVREILNLDLFTVRTQFLQNVLVGKIRGENLVENRFNPLDNTTLTLGKYLGTDLFLEALVRFQNVEDLTTTSNIRTEGELNLEWVTPFFLLEWTFTPSHPENLFLTDNSIGLSWKYSY